MVTPRSFSSPTIEACCRLSTMNKRPRVRMSTRPVQVSHNLCRRLNAWGGKTRARSLVRLWSGEGDIVCCIEPDLFHWNVTLTQSVQFNPLHIQLKQILECIIH